MGDRGNHLCHFRVFTTRPEHPQCGLSEIINGEEGGGTEEKREKGERGKGKGGEAKKEPQRQNEQRKQHQLGDQSRQQKRQL
jgi:hypothetical protein